MCLNCKNEFVYENIKNIDNVRNLKNEYCQHAKVCEILFEEKNVKQQNRQEHFIEILLPSKNRKHEICLVHPSEGSEKNPGIIIVNSRSTKPKCHTCKGFKCLHINIFLEGVSKNGPNKTRNTKILTSDEAITLKATKMDALSEKCKNELDPTDKTGAMSNVFGVQINFPPSTEEKKEISRINNLESLYSKDYIVPHVKVGEKCECGFYYETTPNLGNVESFKIIIHHSKTTRDSRNSSLVLLYAGTSKCDHKIFYTGEEDKLLRVSGVSIGQNKPIHFISYDMIFEYHSSVLNGGLAQNAFVTSKNELNVMIRGSEATVPRHIFCKGYEIFMHSIRYNRKEAWDCYQCPSELDANEREEDFDDIEVHISDGIDMGTIQNTIKGIVGKEIFEEEKVKNVIVKGVDASERTFLNKKKERDLIEGLKISDDGESNIHVILKDMKKLKSKSRNFIFVQKLLERIKNSSKCLGYRLLLSELGKCSPIAIIFPSHDSMDYKILEAFLEKKIRYFQEF